MENSNNQLTVGFIKPKSVKKWEEIRLIIENDGFELLGSRYFIFSEDSLTSFYEHKVKEPWFDKFKKKMSNKKLLAFLLKKNNAIEEFRKLLGDTNPEKAAEGTLRNLFGEDIENNVAHGCDNPKNLKKEASILLENCKVYTDKIGNLP